MRLAGLTDANLRGANLREANLFCAFLHEADLTDAKLPVFQIVPETGSFIGWKKAGGKIVKLEIPDNAKRTSTLVSRQCRAEFVRVLEIEGAKATTSGKSGVYRVGGITRPDSYDPDIRIECTHGIHFFVTRKEAEEYEE